MRKFLIFAAAWLAMAPRALAITPLDLVDAVQQHQGTVSFEGHRIQLLTRQNLDFKAVLQIDYKNERNYRVDILQPAKLADVNLWLRHDRVNIYFPDENLYFHNDNQSGSTEFAATILGQITADPDLLFANYDLDVYNDDQIKSMGLDPVVAGRDCYILNVARKGQVFYSTPAHRFWIDKQTFQILRETRTWGPQIAPYFDSSFDEFELTNQLHLKARVPRDVNAIRLKTGSRNNSFVTYKSLAEAQTAIGQAIEIPSFVPAGFSLYSIEVPIFYGSRTILLSYTDGANWMFVQYRPKPTLWVTLLAGAYAVKLVEKFQELSFQAPYNYYGADKGNDVVFTYGDLYPDVLKRIGDSLQLQPAGSGSQATPGTLAPGAAPATHSAAAGR